MNEHITIAEKSDLSEILKLQYEAFTRVASEINNYELPSLKQTEQEMQEQFAHNTILKYCIDGCIVGSIRGRLDDDKICHVGSLIVAAGYQNMGIGRSLMEAIEEQFPNCEKYALFTSPETPNTRHLYEKLGYKIISKGKPDGIEFLFMEKESGNTSF